MRKVECLDRGWRFLLGDDPAAKDPGFEDADWRVLDVPHDWSIEATPQQDAPAEAGGGFFPGGVGWYRKVVAIPADLGDRHVLLAFDGIYMNSEVWCNGTFCGKRPYGYSSFCYDLTSHVQPGTDAVLAVRVDNSHQKNSRWYSGSGIYRHVWLTWAAAIRIGHWGSFVTTPVVSRERASVACTLSLINESGKNAEIEVEASILAVPPGGEDAGSYREGAWCPAGKVGTPLATEVETVTLAAGATATERRMELALREPRLWSPATPDLYVVRVVLRRGAEVIDVYDTRFGVRELQFDAQKGFFLNGSNMKLQGVNEHHDAGCLGAAVPDDVVRRRLQILKDMGCNAIRIAHNPASPTLLDLCDEKGFLVVEDAFDEWKDSKTTFGYGLYWDDWWEQDLVDMIRRDRNHPCIVLWSVGNEIKEVRQGRPEGLPMMRALRAVCHREDPTRLMTCGCCNARETLAAGYGPLMDVFGYNGGGGGCFDYEKDHATYPDMIMLATEHPHTLQTRGVYRTQSWYRDLARKRDAVRWYPSPRLGAEARTLLPPDGDKQDQGVLDLMHIPDLTSEERFTGFDAHYQSSYGNAIVRMSILDSWYRTRELPYFCGEFRWTGFDYIGECYGWPCKSWNFGIIDLCGFPKDAYYFCQSQWTREPMVHILPHWTWPGLEGKQIPVLCYTNCERVELFQDGVSLGVQPRNDTTMELRWDVTYRPGKLEAIGYVGRKGVVQTVHCCHETAGIACGLRLTCDEEQIRADGTGIAHVVVTVIDQAGRFVPSANEKVCVAVEGPGRLVGLENGDPLDRTNYKADHRSTFHGMLLAVIQAGEDPGTITVSAQAEGLEPARCQVPTACMQ